MAIRRIPTCVGIVLAMLLGAVSLVPACSETSKHRVLSFFFDGVPQAGPETQVGSSPRIAPQGPIPSDTPLSGLVRRTVYAHPPYRNNRCNGCHNPQDGQILKPVEEGLCLSCHDVPGDVRYVHGPVNVNACLTCHHHHRSEYPRVLLDDPGRLCFHCHQRSDLTTGPHHDTIERQTCIDCHNPHGSASRFFLTIDD